MKQIAYIGKNSINKLSEILNSHSPQKVFLVTGKKSYEKSGAKDLIELILKNTEYYRFYDFEENPKIEDVNRGIDIYKHGKYDLIIAIGGGSVLDMGKLIGILSQQHGDIIEIIKTNKIDTKGNTLIAIPTTAGTGSEATHFAVVYIEGKKYSLANDFILPDYAIVAPELTYSSSEYIAACAGADSLCQAIESMWAVGGTDISKQYAEKAIKLIWENLYDAVISGSKKAKDNVSEGAYWAGKAINISKTTAPHAISYELTSKYNIPHGHAVALTLSEVMKINYIKSTNTKVKENIEKIWAITGSSDLKEAASNIQKLWKSLGIATSLSQLGIKKTEIEDIAKQCNIERMGNNPVKLEIIDIVNLLNSTY